MNWKLVDQAWSYGRNRQLVDQPWILDPRIHRLDDFLRVFRLAEDKMENRQTSLANMESFGHKQTQYGDRLGKPKSYFLRKG